MRFPDDLRFLVIIGFAVLIKQLLSPFHSWFRSITTAMAAVFCAYVFTDPITNILGWDDKTRLALAAVLSLTGEHIIRHIIDAGQDPNRGIQRVKVLALNTAELIALWRKGPDAVKPADKAADHEDQR